MNSSSRRTAVAAPFSAHSTRILLSSLTVLALAYFGSPPAVAAEQGYEMTFYEARPGGAQIAAGRYDAAILSARAGRAVDPDTRLVATTNLCVAYAMRRELAKAEKSCSDAVDLATTADRSSLLRRGESATAKALNNRGVVRALRGDAERASADFRRAALDASTWGVPERNSRALSERTPSDHAVAQAARY